MKFENPCVKAGMQAVGEGERLHSVHSTLANSDSVPLEDTVTHISSNVSLVRGTCSDGISAVEFYWND